MQPRWKRAVNACNVLGEAVGEMYVKKYFPGIWNFDWKIIDVDTYMYTLIWKCFE